ncbi:MAG: hypothetical protein ACXWVA_07020, partial [Rhodoplanes sp.]
SCMANVSSETWCSDAYVDSFTRRNASELWSREGGERLIRFVNDRLSFGAQVRNPAITGRRAFSGPPGLKEVSL